MGRRKCSRYPLLLQLLSFGLTVNTSGASTTQGPSYLASTEQIAGVKIASFFSQCLATWASEASLHGGTSRHSSERPVNKTGDGITDWVLNNQRVTAIYESVGTLGAGSVYHGCDGIPRFKWTGAVTALRTATITVIHQYPTIISKRWTFMRNSEWRSIAGIATPPPEASCNRGNAYTMGNNVANMCNQHEVELLSAAYKAYNGTIGREDCMSMRKCFVQFNHEIALMYWPSEAEPDATCSGSPTKGFEGHDRQTTVPLSPLMFPKTAVMTAITFPGKDIYNRGVRYETIHPGDTKRMTISYQPVNDGDYIPPSTMSGTFTFTSPTVYVAYRGFGVIAAMDITGYITLPNGTSILARHPAVEATAATEGVFPAKSEDVFSLRQIPIATAGLGGMQWAQSVAAGRYDGMDLLPPLELGSNTIFYSNSSSVVENFMGFKDLEYQTLPLNFRDLQNPVPASEYFNVRPDCWGIHTHCGTITDDTYRPNLWINNSFWASLLPSTSGCSIGTVADPPVSLVAISGYNVAMEDSDFQDLPALITSSSAHPTWGPERAQPGGTVELGAPMQTSSARKARPLRPSHYGQDQDASRREGHEDPKEWHRQGDNRENQLNRQGLDTHHNAKDRKADKDPKAGGVEVGHGQGPTPFTGGSDRLVDDSLMTALASSLVAILLLLFLG
jgi:hypothetical protein